MGGGHHLPAYGPGILYLVAVMDWHSRHVVAWRLSNTPRSGSGQALEAGFCAEALTEALGRGRPEVFNTDQGSQFTSREFTQMLEDSGVKISMDGKGPDTDALLQQTLGDVPAGVAEGAGYYGVLRMGQEVGFLTFLGS